MREKTSLIITSISKPNDVMKAFAKGAAKHGIEFIVIGDKSSPADFSLRDCSYYSLESQVKLDFEFARQCPVKRYSRKNIGYLLAMASGAKIILESDDDNFPREKFWSARTRKIMTRNIENVGGWLNVYGYFSKSKIWPRGLPLEVLNDTLPALKTFQTEEVNCPIQQGLADMNPDVDAIYRLTMTLPQNFRKNITLSLGNKTWCPFNSQNTTFYKDAFPLLYLPSYCSFRMTDIWRSFVAQRIAWENNWNILFHSATVWQERNDHSLIKDFEDEIPGYLQNAKIGNLLSGLKLKKGKKNIADNLLTCYQALVDASIVGPEEMGLLRCWLNDLKKLGIV